MIWLIKLIMISNNKRRKREIIEVRPEKLKNNQIDR